MSVTLNVAEILGEHVTIRVTTRSVGFFGTGFAERSPGGRLAGGGTQRGVAREQEVTPRRFLETRLLPRLARRQRGRSQGLGRQVRGEARRRRDRASCNRWPPALESCARILGREQRHARGRWPDCGASPSFGHHFLFESGSDLRRRPCRESSAGFRSSNDPAPGPAIAQGSPSRHSGSSPGRRLRSSFCPTSSG